jgi:hypothetical protein
MNILPSSSGSKSKLSKRLWSRALFILLVWFEYFQPWRWRLYVHSKCRWTSTRLQSVTSQQIVIFTVTAVSTLDPIGMSSYFWEYVIRVYILRNVILNILFSGYRSRGPGFDSRRFQIFWEAAGLERGPLSLVRTTEELLEGKVAAPV